MGGSTMSTLVGALSDAESQRQRALLELETESGRSGLDEFRPGTFGCHELLDRTHQIADLIEKALLTHPACLQNQEWYQLAFEASAAMNELYQRVGAAHLGAPDPADASE
jgi:hypothetical protein